jgi:nucleoside-triphosphatase
LLTGEPRIGKTTTLKKVIEALGFERCGGFYTVEVCAQGERCGFRLITLDAQAGTLADVTLDGPLRVGRYGVTLQTLEAIALPVLYKALASKEFVVIDELGPMQLFSDKLMLAVMSVLESTHPLVGTAFSGSHPWLDELKRRDDVELFPVTHQNRDEIPTMVRETLRTMK